MKIIRDDRRWKLMGFDHVIHDCLEILAIESGYRVGKMCEGLGCSERYLFELFQRDIGLSPKIWLRQQRMSLACRKLVAGEAIQEIGSALGFSSAGNFGREFRRVYGVSPRSYLKRRLDGAEISQ